MKKQLDQDENEQNESIPPALKRRKICFGPMEGIKSRRGRDFTLEDNDKFKHLFPQGFNGLDPNVREYWKPLSQFDENDNNVTNANQDGQQMLDLNSNFGGNNNNINTHVNTNSGNENRISSTTLANRSVSRFSKINTPVFGNNVNGNQEKEKNQCTQQKQQDHDQVNEQLKNQFDTNGTYSSISSLNIHGSVNGSIATIRDGSGTITTTNTPPRLINIKRLQQYQDNKSNTTKIKAKNKVNNNGFGNRISRSSKTLVNGHLITNLGGTTADSTLRDNVNINSNRYPEKDKSIQQQQQQQQRQRQAQRQIQVNEPFVDNINQISTNGAYSSSWIPSLQLNAPTNANASISNQNINPASRVTHDHSHVKTVQQYQHTKSSKSKTKKRKSKDKGKNKNKNNQGCDNHDDEVQLTRAQVSNLLLKKNWKQDTNDNDYDSAITTFITKINTDGKTSKLKSDLKILTNNENFLHILRQYTPQGKIGQPSEMMSFLKETTDQPTMKKHGINFQFPQAVLQHTRLQQIMEMDLRKKSIDQEIEKISSVENMLNQGKAINVLNLNEIIGEKDFGLTAIKNITIGYCGNSGQKYELTFDIDIYSLYTFCRFCQPAGAVKLICFIIK